MVLNVEFARQTNTDTKKIPCGFNTRQNNTESQSLMTNQHWQQKSSMLASMPLCTKKKGKKRSTDINFQVFNVEFITMIRKKSVHCWVCIDKPTLTSMVFNAGFIALQKRKSILTLIFKSSKRYIKVFIVWFNHTSHIYTWKRMVFIIEFALTNQHWHQKLQCWLQSSTKQTNKKTTNQHWHFKPSLLVSTIKEWCPQ